MWAKNKFIIKVLMDLDPVPYDLGGGRSTKIIASDQRSYYGARWCFIRGLDNHVLILLITSLLYI